jgi:pyruvate formate lyase activating enzyme
MPETLSWAEALRRRTVPGSPALCIPLRDDWVRCFACGHACKIPPGRPGVCQVRFNDAGTLRVPHGYVAALACDPIEKKPFFHALPGTEALSFGMLGCDLHCAYCFSGDTLVDTDRGSIALEALFRSARRTETKSDAAIAYPDDLHVRAGSGAWRRVRAVFKHAYNGTLLSLHTESLPALRCTPDHRIYSRIDSQPTWRQLVRGRREAVKVRAVELRPGHVLFTPAASSAAAGIGLRRSGGGAGLRDSVATGSDLEAIPVRGISMQAYTGPVYNLEVEDEHNYFAGSLLVSNCQNWETSQAIRDPDAVAPPRPVSPADLALLAVQRGAMTLASTYNEPLITSEWAVEVFREAKKRGLRTAYISNGNGTPEVLEYLRPWVDLYKVDLKSFRDRSYRQLGGRLDRILDTIPRLVGMGFWVEIVTLVIPGFNDSDEELTEVARFLAGISPDIPWHVTAFHKDYKMTDPDDTPVATLLRGWEIGRREGLRYVYAGNRPGRVGDRENTRCPQCSALLVERQGFTVRTNRLRGGACPDCSTSIPGVWS